MMKFNPMGFVPFDYESLTVMKTHDKSINNKYLLDMVETTAIT